MTPFVPVYGDGVFLAGDGYIAPLPGDPAPNALEVMAWPSMTESCAEETLPWTTYHVAGERPVVVMRFPRALMLLVSAQAFATMVAVALAALAAARSHRR